MTLVASLNRKWDRDGNASLRRSRAQFVELKGEAAAAVRQAFIDALPHVEWKGKPLVTLRCTGVTGKGPHDANVPESLLWALVDPRTWRCPYHV